MQKHIEQLAQLLIQYKHCYATSKFDVGKIKVELNLTIKATTVSKKQRIPYSYALTITRTSTTLTRHFDTF